MSVKCARPRELFVAISACKLVLEIVMDLMVALEIVGPSKSIPTPGPLALE